MQTDKKRGSLGIYGGTFDPFHLGHLHALRAFSAAIRPDLILLMPTFLPPHKVHRAGDRPEARLAMLRALAREEEFRRMHCTVSDFEIAKQGKSYSYDTLCHFFASDRELYFLMGTDMFCSLESWYRGAELFSLAHMVCVRRGGENEEAECARIAEAEKRYRALYGARVTVLEAEPFALSSTQVRMRLAAGGDAALYCPAPIAREIERNGYYRG